MENLKIVPSVATDNMVKAIHNIADISHEYTPDRGTQSNIENKEDCQCQIT